MSDSPDTRAVEIVLDGPPRGKERVRVRAAGGVYTPARTVAYEGRLALAAQAAMVGRELLSGPLHVAMRVYVPVAASRPKRFREAALAHRELPVKKPDIDNFAKIVDALNMIVWVDDSQIVDLVIAKRYSDRPRLEITVSPTMSGVFE